MPFFEFLFSPQAHKFRDGYFINHDTLLSVDEKIRQKLIFYFIASQVPQKLGPQDRDAYQKQRLTKIDLPRSIWMDAALFGPLTLALITKKASFSNVRSLAIYAVLGGLLTPLASTLYTRVYEGRFVESSKVIDQLSKKYQFGIYDFALAKKEAHVLQLLHSMDAPYGTLHQE